MEKRFFIVGIVIAVVLIILVLGLDKKPTGNVTGEKVPVVPLDEEERAIVTETISESEIISDLPDDDVIAVVFYDYKNQEGEKQYRDTFRVTQDGVVSNGKSTVRIYVHSKYIEEFENADLCSIMAKAIDNGDVSYASDLGSARLLFKYRDMLRHKDCLGV